jgi:hypothetical protein
MPRPRTAAEAAVPIVLLLPLLASRRPRLPPAVAPEPGLPPALPQGSSGDVVAVDAAVVAQLWLRAAGLIVPCWCCERTSRTCPAVTQCSRSSSSSQPGGHGD